MPKPRVAGRCASGARAGKSSVTPSTPKKPPGFLNRFPILRAELSQPCQVRPVPLWAHRIEAQNVCGYGEIVDHATIPTSQRCRSISPCSEWRTIKRISRPAR